jgi:hypothetical protein
MSRFPENNKLDKESYLHLPFSHSLQYKYVGKNKRGLSATEQIFMIDGKDVPYHHHPLSMHGTATRKARPRVQLTEEHAERMQLPIIDETSSDVTKVVFPSGRVNYVLLARRNSKYPILRDLHKYMDEHAPHLDEFVSKLDKRSYLKDDLGGGRYVASGFGNMGKNVPATVRPPNQPALRQCLKYAEHQSLAKIVGGIFSQIAKCIAKFCGGVYEENQKLMKQNPNLAWPPLDFQNSEWKWMSSQFIVRRWGPALAEPKWTLDKVIVAAHTDRGDLDSTMFICYTTGGGKRGKGGPVAGTDLAVFEHAAGGAGFRVKTCIEDTVVVVVLNSNRQVHGCIKNEASFAEDSSAWTTRIVPYVPIGVYHWMIRHPDGFPFTDIP